MVYFVRHCTPGTEWSGWWQCSQRRWQQLEKACGFNAPAGHDATVGFSGMSPKSGLHWEGITYDPYKEK